MAIKQKLLLSQKMAESKWNTRKLVGFVTLFFGSLLLCYTSKATGAETYQLWIWLFGIYVTGNIGSKIVAPAAIFGKLKTKLSRKLK